MFTKIRGGSTLIGLLFLASSAIASVIGVRHFERMGSATAFVISGFVASGEIITAKHLKRVQVDSDTMAGSIQDPKALIGEKTNIAKKDGELVFPNELKITKAVGLSHVIPAGRVLFSLTQPNMRLPVSKLTRGDLLDVLVRGKYGVKTVARSVQVIGVMKQGNATAAAKTGAYSQVSQPSSQGKSNDVSMVLAVDPKDVYPLASISSRDQISLIVHSAYDIKNGTLQTISTTKPFHEIEVLTDLSRTKVRIGI